MVLIGSSSILGTIGLSDSMPATVAAIVTLAAACGSLFVEHFSRILNPNLGNIFDAFQNLQTIAHNATFLAKELKLAVTFRRSAGELSNLIGRGNELMSKVNEWNPQIFTD